MSRTARWVDVDMDQLPAEVYEFVETVMFLKMCSDPQASSSLHLAGSRNGEWAAEPGKSTEHWRRMLSRWLRKISRWDSDLTDEISGERRSRAKVRCKNCHYGLRPQAQWCDRCGSPDLATRA